MTTDTPAMPDYVRAWTLATKNTPVSDPWKTAACFYINDNGWAVPVPDISDAQWRKDVMDGMANRNIIMTFFKNFDGRFGVVVDHDDEHPHYGPNIDHALCNAVLQAIGAEK